MHRVLYSVILMAGAATTPSQAATEAQWIRDIDRIVVDIRGTHPQPFAIAGETRFMRAVRDLKSEISLLSEEQRLVRAMQLVAMIGDGHTQLNPTSLQFARWYPFRIYDFDDGYFLTGVHQDAADLAGSQVLEIDGRPIAEVAAVARSLHGADNEFDARWRLFALHNAGLMTGLGFADSEGRMHARLKLASGAVVEKTILPLQGQSPNLGWIYQPEYWGAIGDPAHWISAYQSQTVEQLRAHDASRPLHIRHRRLWYHESLPDQSTYYIQVNGVFGNGEESLPGFFRRVLGEVDAVRPDHLILDIRYNFGGDGSNVPAVIREFLARGSNPPWQNLYLLTGRRTFSAAVLWTAEMLEYLEPTVIGEPAGAGLNTFGDTNSFSYPDTGMQLFVSFERHFRGKSTDYSPFIPVNYPARFTFADYVAGRDPAVDPILNGAEMRSVARIAAADGSDAAFAEYAERTAKFDETWRAPSEIDLRSVMNALRENGELEAAIEVGTLNTRINPLEWRTWQNLGHLQRAAGRIGDAVESYQRSVALDDPTNFNADFLRGLIEELGDTR